MPYDGRRFFSRSRTSGQGWHSCACRIFACVYSKQQSRRDHIGLNVPSEFTGRLAIWTEKEGGGSSSGRLECVPLEKESEVEMA